MSEEQLEANEADTAEQRLGVLEDEETAPATEPPPVEADPADAVEQRLVVPQNEDDYR